MWEAMKNKLIINLELPTLNKLIDFVYENLMNLAEIENSHNSGIIENILDLVLIICMREKRALQTLP
jgi:hypothetical protein